MTRRWARCWTGIGVAFAACTVTEPVTDLTLTPRATCADPSARSHGWFTHHEGAPRAPVPGYAPHGAGVVIGDWTGDGAPDLLILHDDGLEFYVADPAPGTFRLVEDPGVDRTLPHNAGGATADFDADGDLDIMVGRRGAPNLLLRNDGTGRFEDVAPELGVAGPARGMHGSPAWADVDADGDLDLIVAGHGAIPDTGFDPETSGPGEPSLLFLAHDGGFRDASDQLPQRLHDAYTFVLTPLDLDNDGDLDLYAANDFGRRHVPCLLLWNEGGTWVLDNGASNLDLPLSAMGTGVGDVNQDGAWDLLLPAWGRVASMQSAGSTWIDTASAQGIEPDRERSQVVGWGAELIDVDNDGDLDAPVVFGFLDSATARNDRSQPDGLWVQHDGGVWVDEAPLHGLDHPGAGRGLGVADLDRDGFLDLVVPDLEGPVQIHRSVCGSAPSLQVRLHMTGQNPDAVGAIVDVTTDVGRHRRVILAGGSSLHSGGPPEAHVGLGDAATITQLVVTWPDGIVTTHRDLPLNHVVTVERP